MRGDQDGLAHPVQFHQQRQDAQRHLPVHVAGGLIGQDHIGIDDHCAGESGTLAFPPRQLRGQGVRQVAEANPSQQICKVLRRAFAVGHGEGQRHVGGQCQVVEEFAVLMHDPDAAAGAGHIIARQRGHIAVKQRHAAAGGLKLGIGQLEEGRLARAGRPGQKMERPGGEPQRDISQKVPAAIAVSRVFEGDHDSPFA